MSTCLAVAAPINIQGKFKLDKLYAIIFQAWPWIDAVQILQGHFSVDQLCIGTAW